jgi:hypothetical protein
MLEVQDEGGQIRAMPRPKLCRGYETIQSRSWKLDFLLEWDGGMEPNQRIMPSLALSVPDNTDLSIFLYSTSIVNHEVVTSLLDT